MQKISSSLKSIERGSVCDISISIANTSELGSTSNYDKSAKTLNIISMFKGKPIPIKGQLIIMLKESSIPQRYWREAALYYILRTPYRRILIPKLLKTRIFIVYSTPDFIFDNNSAKAKRLTKISPYPSWAAI